MAKRKPAKSAAPTDTRTLEQKTDAELVKRGRRRYRVMVEADQENRENAMDDFKFVNQPGAQWDNQMRQFRGARPCYEFNELRIKCKRIINDMRANRPQAKIRGTKDSTKATAEVIEGLGRNIWNVSDGDTIIDAAGEYQVGAGMACWEVTTDYASDLSFDQDIGIEGIKNPFCLHVDPACQDSLKRDAKDWIKEKKVTRAEYESRWPDKKVVNFGESNPQDDDEDWGAGSGDDEDQLIRVIEYWYKEPLQVELWKLIDGRVIDAADEAAQFVQPEQIAPNGKRTVKSHQIMVCILSGDAILESPKVVVGKEFPFVMIFGESVVIDGKTYWFGLPRFSKDAQRNLNITQTAAMESTAQTLQNKIWATAKQAEGHLDKWFEAFRKNIPIALYNPDPAAPGPPQRQGGPELPVAMLQLGQQSHALLNSTSGIYDASEGAPSNEKSGRAIIARQQQGDIATFNFQDNMAKGIQRTWEIIIDRIPKVYDTERSLRILGADGTDSYVKVNEIVLDPKTQKPVKLNDLNEGKYDVTITTGPNFSTKRQEATEMYGQLIQQFPQIMGVAGDLVAKSWDLPYSEQIAERLQTLLPPQIQQTLNKDKKVPPEIQQAMLQVNQAMQAVQQQGQLVQAAAQELEQNKALGEKQQAEIKAAIADLKTQQARFDADVAKQLAALRVAQVEAQQSMTTDVNAQERQDLSVQLQSAVAEIQQMGAAFMSNAAQTMADIASKQQTQVIVPPRPKVIATHLVRENGQTKAVHQYEGEPPPQKPALTKSMPADGGMMQ